MKITKNFSMSEFDCNNGVKVPEKYYENVKKLARNLQILRDEFNLPIRINSGYRTKDYNKKIGGSPRSQHLEAKAADIWILGVSPRVIKAKLERLISDGLIDDGGIGLYPTFVHYDIRFTPTRWEIL